VPNRLSLRDLTSEKKGQNRIEAGFAPVIEF
jgi:hypothetical protein